MPAWGAGPEDGRIALSICIPTFKRREFLRQALESIVTQAEGPTEVVISGCDSGDGTREMAEAYARRYPCVHYFDEGPNRGADRGFLRCVERARGRYVWIFSDDDVMMPGAIERVLREILSEPGVDVFHIGNLFLGSGKKHMIGLTEFGYYGRDAIYSSAEGFLSEERLAYSGYLSAIVMRKRVWDSHARAAESVIGTTYVHLYILLSALRDGAKVKTLAPPYILNRPDNDSFQDRSLSREMMMAKRRAIDIEGYDRLTSETFGKGSRMNRRANMAVMRLLVLPEVAVAKAGGVGEEYFSEIRRLSLAHYSSYPFYRLVLAPLLSAPRFLFSAAVWAVRRLRR